MVIVRVVLITDTKIQLYRAASLWLALQTCLAGFNCFSTYKLTTKHHTQRTRNQRRKFCKHFTV